MSDLSIRRDPPVAEARKSAPPSKTPSPAPADPRQALVKANADAFSALAALLRD